MIDGSNASSCDAFAAPYP